MSNVVECSYCAVCRRNHDDGRKHIFTSKHLSKLSQLLTKFGNKVLAARKLLEKPVVLEGELEPGATVWCYCCDTEVNKHVCDGLLTIEWGGLLEHLTSRNHHKKTRHYWWRHGADSSKLQSFVVFDAEYLNFKAKVADQVVLVEQQKEQRLQEAAQALRLQEEKRKEVSTEPPPAVAAGAHVVFTTVSNKFGVLQNPTGWHEGRRVWGGGIVRLKPGSDQLLTWEIDHIDGYTDMSAGSSGGHTEGNIHTGATPPWLKEEEEEAPAIGPSLDAFLLHREQQRRASKNPNRVGADFHRTKPKNDSDDWLPSFGRVWNAGSRTASRLEFGQENKGATHHSAERNQQVKELMSEGSVASSGEKNPQLKPYIRKRQASSTAGVS